MQRCSVRVQRCSVRVQRCSVRVQRCSVRVQRCSVRVQRCSVRVQRCSVRVQRCSVRVQRCSVRVQRCSVRVQRCSVRVQRCSVRVQRCSVSSALACCKAGPSSNLGSAPHGGSAHWADSYEDMEMGLNECLWINDVWMYEYLYKRKINAKRVAYGHQTLKKKLTSMFP